MRKIKKKYWLFFIFFEPTPSSCRLIHTCNFCRAVFRGGPNGPGPEASELRGPPSVKKKILFNFLNLIAVLDSDHQKMLIDLLIRPFVKKFYKILRFYKIFTIFFTKVFIYQHWIDQNIKYYSLDYLLVIEESGWIRFRGVAFFPPRRRPSKR